MALLVGALPLQAHAQYRRPVEEDHFKVGLGVGMRPDYEGSDEYQGFPIGFLRYDAASGRYAAIKGTESSGAAVRMEGNLIASKNWQFGPVLQYRLPRNHVGNGQVEDMANIDAAWEMGGFVGAKFAGWLGRVTGVGDISGEHEGGLVELLGGYESEYDSGVGVQWHLASTWASDGYMETYFGVTPGDAVRSGLPTYNTGYGFKDVGTRLAMSWGPESWGAWRLYGIFSYFRLIDNAEDSPIVDGVGDPNQLFGGIAVAYEQ
jgi:outer membrane protein